MTLIDGDLPVRELHLHVSSMLKDRGRVGLAPQWQ
jgi:hypothetical protein